MKIVTTGSLGNVGSPLVQRLVQENHHVTVISSNNDRKQAIEAMGAKAAIGTLMDEQFLIDTFQGADIVYLMGAWEAVGSIFDKTVDFEAGFIELAYTYKKAIIQSQVKKVIYLSTIGAHTDKGIGVLKYHYQVEQILQQLPEEVFLKFMRPVGFYTNLLRSIPTIKEKGSFVQNFGSNTPEPWVSPKDIAQTIAGEMKKPFNGREIRYIASEEISATEIAKKIGNAIGKPALTWITISDEEMLNALLSRGMNQKMAEGYVEMQAAQRSGYIYEDYYRYQPQLGSVKFSEFAHEFAVQYQQEP